MPKTANSINKELYELLNIKNFDPEGIKLGKKSIVPEEATGFNFTFKDGKKQYGSAHVAVDNLENLILFYNKSAMKDVISSWTKFCVELKNWAMKRGLGFKADTLDNLNDYMERRHYNENLNEGYYGTRHTSYSDKAPESIKLIIKHNKALDENDQRFRYVDKIFVENVLGERFLLPTKSPSVGYVFARHIAEGGTPYDERGKHIAQLSEDVAKLGAFLRATRNKQFNESVNTVIYEAASKYLELRETMKKLRSSRGFRNYFENWTPTLMETGDVAPLDTAFRNNSIDHRIEAALPVLSRYNIGTTELNETFADSDDMIDEDLQPSMTGQVDELIELLGPESEPLPLGPDASNVIGRIDELLQDDDLYERLQAAAEADPNNDARPVIIGWMSEHVDDDDAYEEVLSKIESSEPEMPENPEPPATEPSPSEEVPELPKKPSADAMKKMPEMPSRDDKQSPEKMQSAPPLEESDELHRIRQLIGIQK